MLISITGRTTGQQYGREAEVYETNLDRLFDIMNRGKPSGQQALKRMRAEVDSIIDAAGDLLPITASVRRSMKAVRLPGDRSRPDLAEVTARFWSAYLAEHPQPVEPNRQSRISTMRQQKRRAK